MYCIAGISPFIALLTFRNAIGTPIRTLEKAQEAGFAVDPKALQEEKLREVLTHNPFVH